MKIEVSELSYRYESRQVLDEVSAVFESGKVSLLTGESGCGKTTLLRCINGLIPHRYTRGELNGVIKFDGNSTTDMLFTDLSSQVGTVLQDPKRQMIATDVRGEIAFALENLALEPDEIRVRVDECANRLGIFELLDCPVNSLSGGQQQKVAIAGALVLKPKALVLDEPLSSLDPPSAADMMIFFRELAENGITVVLSEHRHDAVLAHGSVDTFVLKDGKVLKNSGLQKQVWPACPTFKKSSDDEPLVEVEKVSYLHLAGNLAIDDVSLRIFPGEVIALVGMNGAGKSTLCRLLIGLQKPARGIIKVRGEDISNKSVAEISRTVGYVFQRPSAMLFAKNLREDLEFGPSNLGLSRKDVDKRVKDAANAMILADRLNDDPYKLSLGMQKRASVAGVLAMTPKVMILDEPTAGQDFENVRNLMNQLMAMMSDDQLSSLLIVTHEIPLALAYASRLVILNQGQVAADVPISNASTPLRKYNLI